MFQEAIDLFFTISNPNDLNFMLFFNACAGIGTKNALPLIEKGLSTVPKYYCEDARILIAVFDAYVKCGDLLNAEKVLSKMKRTVKSYGNLMNAYNEDDQPDKTLNLYNRMTHDRIEPNSLIYVFLLNACAKIGTFTISQSVSEQIPSSFLNDPYVQTSLIDMWVSVIMN